jgi:hypothetical protein
MWTVKTKSLLPSLSKGRNYPSLAAGPRGPLARRAKRGEGRFPEAYVLFIMDSLVSSSLSYLLTNLDFMVILLELA